jgi:uncharacterized membrane protein
MTIDPAAPARPRPARPFRAAVLRGLGVFLPPLLTVVFLIWIFGSVQEYILEPVQNAARYVLARSLADIREKDSAARPVRGNDGQVDENYLRWDDVTFRRAGDDSFVPEHVYQIVADFDGYSDAAGMTGREMYERYVEIRYLKWYYVLPAFTALFILLLYLVGKFIAVGHIGNFLWGTSERLIYRVPFVRNVYSSVKQVTDFVFNRKDFKFTRVVAVEYPRKLQWALGFVTGEGFVDIREAAGERVLSVLVPTSPMPVTGFVIMVQESEVLYLNITIDQALEYIVSCGVVVPAPELQAAQREKRERQRHEGRLLPDDRPSALEHASSNGEPSADGAAERAAHAPRADV